MKFGGSSSSASWRLSRRRNLQCRRNEHLLDARQIGVNKSAPPEQTESQFYTTRRKRECKKAKHQVEEFVRGPAGQF
ncbi:hypothetical protein TcasGA2_TC003890 [Tribolium castaneum]|uniref:Uncharacterized protein n=1 Tax=Tribolium castaneum TaxID=7070 RepID=D6WH69_TRICA|nr:hypothetical protein TcasGA2_TC003890 [Tribolium castaneum]